MQLSVHKMIKTMRYFTVLVLLMAFNYFMAAQEDSVKITTPSARNANYDMDVKLNTEKKIVNGQMQLTWRNISQDTITELQFHLYLNAFKNTKTTFMKESGGSFRGDVAGDDALSWGYIDIEDLRIKNGENLTPKIEFIQPDDGNKNDQTVIRVPLADSVGILPGQTVEILCKFESKLPKIFARTGFVGNYFFVGQWFPKIGVYEPAGMRYATKGGWNCHQFHAHSEFYADFGVYNVNITVPEDYTVGATGVVVEEKSEGNTKTYKYHAKDVIDFAWTASQKYLDLRKEWENIEIRLLLQPEHKDQAERHFVSVKHALEYFKKHLGEYPYPNITIVDPPIYAMGAGGMEYPTLITAGSFAWMPEGLNPTEMVTIHEFGHQYFMGIFASNEFEEAWMDEGMNSYFETRIMDDAYGKNTSWVDFAGIRIGDTEMQRTSYVHSDYRNIAESYRYAWEYPHGGYSMNSYSKPATFLNTLHRLVGDECNDDIWKTYYQRWKFKHPSSKDFIAVVNEVVAKHHKEKFGKNMNWFFDQVLYGSGICDYKILTISNREIQKEKGLFDLDGKKINAGELQTDSTKKYEAKVRVKREGDVIMPVEVLIRFADGQEITKKWSGRERSYEFKFYTDAKIVSAYIDPANKLLIDVNLANNSKQYKPAMNPVWKYTAKFLFWMQNIIQSIVWFV
jgi:hypothetical protein